MLPVREEMGVKGCVCVHVCVGNLDGAMTHAPLNHHLQSNNGGLEGD